MTTTTALPKVTYSRHTGFGAMDNDCDARFNALPGESVVDAEARSRAAGWATFEAFGSVANFCPQHGSQP